MKAPPMKGSRLSWTAGTIIWTATATVLYAQSPLDSLAIEVTSPSREFSFTNKETAFLYGETNGDNASSWMGFNVFGHEFLDDYKLLVDGKELKRKEATRTVVYPDYLVRYYPNDIVEQVRPADSLALFAVIVTSQKPIELAVAPLFADGHTRNEFHVTYSDETALIARSNHLSRSPEQNYPVWLAVHGPDFSPLNQEWKEPARYSPLMMVGKKSRAHMITFAVADSNADARSIAHNFLLHSSSSFARRRARMERLLRETEVHTENGRFDKSLAWAKLSLDALIMNQVTKGIFAGLPWFNNYWGRDTFISLPGACLVTGRFGEARNILASFAAFQQRDTNSTDHGRIPNIVTTTDKSYNTADGTPRFTMMAREYTMRSGDSLFMIEVYPVVLRSIEGTLRYHTDSSGYLTHADAETWMDAVGPDGPWSPRGNRANDIQALWAQQLDAGIWFATQLGDAVSAHRWDNVLKRVKKNFLSDFVAYGKVMDHLNADGSKDEQVRPNQIFTAYLLDERMRADVLTTVVNKLTYEYGIASLSQEDVNFHPYHQFSTYPKDAAYHNGTVWTWLQGPVISELCNFNQQELAWKVTANSIHQILDRGAVGTQSELLDGVPKPTENEPELSGTFSQAWNLAEFVRNFYDDYLGARLTRYDHTLVLRPRIPESLGNVRAVINLDGRAVPVEISSSSRVVLINGQNLRIGGKGIVELPIADGRSAVAEFAIQAGSLIRVELKDTIIAVWKGQSKISSTTNIKQNNLSIASTLAFAKPEIRSGLKALKGPDHPLITHSVLKSTNPHAKQLAYADDPIGDDTGIGVRDKTQGRYTYPRNPFFVPGCLDITRFSVSYDSALAYFTLKFRALSNPGWHTEYGFQLTYVAIAIDQDGIASSGSRTVPRNSNYILEDNGGYERLILIGGGIRLEDSRGKVLAEYLPAASDVSNPMGNVENSTISFALPLSYLGSPEKKWRFTVLVGGQDDHGGAGIGEFRTVNKEACEWNGGGQREQNESNVYDNVTAGGS